MAPSTVSYLGGIHELVKGERDVYSGYDHEAGSVFTIAAGEEAEVSAAKAEQLAADFPGCFEIDGKPAGERPKRGRAKSDGGDLHEELLKHNRGELNAAAAELGIEAPEALPNKAAVVDAIVAKKTEADGEPDGDS